MANEAQSKSAKKQGKSGRRKNSPLTFLIKLAGFAFLCYAVVSLIVLQVEIAENKQQLNELKNQTSIAQGNNDELERLLGSENKSEYYAKIARDQLGYAYPDERVYYDVSGN